MGQLQKVKGFMVNVNIWALANYNSLFIVSGRNIKRFHSTTRSSLNDKSLINLIISIVKKPLVWGSPQQKSIYS